MQNTQNKNYSAMLESTISTLGTRRPTLLLHSCCAPCSSYVLEYLCAHFDITLLFFNPNISPESEYKFRADELERLVSELPEAKNVKIIHGRYCPEEFYAIAKGLEALSEGGERCQKCYRLRLRECARLAAEGGFDYFTTTLSISPYKNAQWLNTIGDEEGRAVGVQYLFSDFKKKNGYKRSCELSAIYNLYRQDYCGCVYSKMNKK